MRTTQSLSPSILEEKEYPRCPFLVQITSENSDQENEWHVSGHTTSFPMLLMYRQAWETGCVQLPQFTGEETDL